MVISIDFGSSGTCLALFDGKKLLAAARSDEKLFSAAEIESFLNKNCFPKAGIGSVAITGGKSPFFRQSIFGIKPIFVNEIDAIGNGAAFLSKKNRCLAVSMGTGTCIVLFENGKCSHIIGTGVGGGTITGLSKLLLGTAEISRLNSLAARGNTANVDLTIGDVVGKKFGILPEDATSSNFAKLRSTSKQDLAAAIQGLVAESVAVLAITAARQCDCDTIVFCGKTPSFPFVKKRLLSAAELFGARFLFPEKFEFGTAVGAAIVSGKEKE